MRGKNRSEKLRKQREQSEEGLQEKRGCKRRVVGEEKERSYLESHMHSKTGEKFILNLPRINMVEVQLH